MSIFGLTMDTVPLGAMLGGFLAVTVNKVPADTGGRGGRADHVDLLHNTAGVSAGVTARPHSHPCVEQRLRMPVAQPSWGHP